MKLTLLTAVLCCALAWTATAQNNLRIQLLSTPKSPKTATTASGVNQLYSAQDTMQVYALIFNYPTGTDSLKLELDSIAGGSNLSQVLTLATNQSVVEYSVVPRYLKVYLGEVPYRSSYYCRSWFYDPTQTLISDIKNY